MITSWHIENFKSYRGEHTVPLSLINIIAGSNSSGKSTLIQSLLALKQTVQFGSPDKSLLLNGPLLRLGSFDDVLNSSCEHRTIAIGFECSFTSSDISSILKESDRNPFIYFSTSSDDDYICRISSSSQWVEGDVTAEIGSNQAYLSPRLLRSSLSVMRNNSPHETFMRLNGRQSDLFGKVGRSPFEIISDAASLQEMSKDKPDAQMVGGYAEYFLPRFVAVQFNSAAKRADEISKHVFAGSFSMLGSSSAHDSFLLSANVLSVISPWMEERGIAMPDVDEFGHVTAYALRESIKSTIDRINYFPGLGALSLSPREINERKSEISSLTASVSAIIASEMTPEKAVEGMLPSTIREASNVVVTLLKAGVRYLGPLRNPPRPVYQLEALPSSTDVGFRGEHTAAILDLNAAKRIEYFLPPSDDLSNDYVSVAKKKNASFHDAVVEWLSYLGVAEEVKTSDEGVFGNRLQVMTGKGAKLHDLTNVGVGVSQVLPIVVMALLAPRASLLVFEQPELHLHPRVQARLGDFFLALAADGRQVFAETHSEYLIDRLRLRVALASDNRVREFVNVMFSTKDEQGTKIVPIEISEYGAITNWPPDFFDQSQNDIAKILKAAALKRKQKANI
jgi:predicted ATPase